MNSLPPKLFPYGARVQVAPVIQEECTSSFASEQLAIGDRFLVKVCSSLGSTVVHVPLLILSAPNFPVYHVHSTVHVHRYD